MKLGINYGIPAAEYHAHSESISKSGLDLVDRSPAHFKHVAKREETRPMQIGSATHMAILEPNLFAAMYVPVREAADRRCKAWNYAVKAATVPEEFLLTGPETERVEAMANAVRANPHMLERLSQKGDAEVSILAKDPETSLLVRIRIDWLFAGTRAMDLKTTEDLRSDAFFRSVWDYRYHVQQALYCDAFYWATGEKLRFEFGVIESKQPHVSVPVSLPADLVKCGEIQYRKNLNRYAECLAKDEWPAPHPEPYILDVPTWGNYRIEDVFEEALIESGEAA